MIGRKAAIAAGFLSLLSVAAYGGYRVYGALFKDMWNRPATLTRANVIDFLNYAHALEAEQVRLYGKQALAAEEAGDEHFAAAMRRARDVEREHLFKIQDQLKRFRVNPSRWTAIGPPLGSVMHGVLSLIGVAGTEKSRRAILRTIVWVEQKAIDHYLRALQQTQDESLRKMYTENLVDEEFHASWAQEMLEQALEREEGDSF